MKRKKYNFGDVLGSLAPMAANAVVPGGGMVANLVLQALNDKNNTVNTNPILNNKSPYGMRKGGQPSGFKQYNAPTHEMGGQAIDGKGNPDVNGGHEIEGTENKYTYANGKTYVFSDVNKTSNMVKDIMKKYKNKDTEKDFAQKNAMEFEVNKVEKLNEIINTARESVQQTVQARYGKKLEGGGNPITPLPTLGLDGVRSRVEPTVLPQLGMDGVRSRPTPPDRLPSLYDMYNNAPPKVATDPITDKLGVPTSVDPTTTSTGAGDILNGDFAGALRTTGLIASGLDALQRPAVEKPVLPDYSKSDARMNSMTSDLTQARQDAVGNYNRASEMNRNAASSYSQYRARQNSSIGNLNDATQNIGLQEQQLKNNIAATQGQYEATKASTVAGIKDNINDRNLANTARSQDFKRQFMSDMVSEADRLSTAKDNKNMSKAKIAEGMAMLKTIAPDFDINATFVENLVKVSKGELDPSKLSNQELIVFNMLNK